MTQLPTDTWLAACRRCSRRRISICVVPLRIELGLQASEGRRGIRPSVPQELQEVDDEGVGQVSQRGR